MQRLRRLQNKSCTSVYLGWPIDKIVVDKIVFMSDIGLTQADVVLGLACIVSKSYRSLSTVIAHYTFVLYNVNVHIDIKLSNTRFMITLRFQMRQTGSMYVNLDMY